MDFSDAFLILKGRQCPWYGHKPKKAHYGILETDEFWTYVGKKGGKVWLIYAYGRGTGEIVTYVWGKRDAGTAAKLNVSAIVQGALKKELGIA